MDVLSIHVCQRKLRNPSQLPGMIEAVVSGDYLPPIEIACDNDGTLSLDDGHHRLVAFWMAGVRELRRQDYLLLPKEHYRPRFGSVLDLWRRQLELDVRNMESALAQLRALPDA